METPSITPKALLGMLKEQGAVPATFDTKRLRDFVRGLADTPDTPIERVGSGGHYAWTPTQARFIVAALARKRMRSSSSPTLSPQDVAALLADDDDDEQEGGAV